MHRAEHGHGRARVGLAVMLLLFGCEGGRPDVLVDLQTDLRAGFDFQSVRVAIVEGPGTPRADWTQTLVVSRADDFLLPERVAEFQSLEPGAYTFEVVLLGEGLRNARREVPVDVRASNYVLAVINRACLSVRCPGPDDATTATQCASGRCVTPECTPDRPENCQEVACQGDTDCGGGGGCVVARCIGGECFEAADDRMCGGDAYCDGATQTCVLALPLDAGTADAGRPDSGPSDSGPPDAGPTCTPASCNDFDPCTSDVCTGGTCTHPALCGGGTYCVRGACVPEPSIDFLTASSPGCIDLGVDHPSGDNFTFRRLTGGRSNGSVQQVNEHISCGLPRNNAGTYSLDAGGNETSSFYSLGQTDCFDPIYGRYRIRAVIDGRESAFDDVTYYNSRCSDISTCIQARTHCSPCIACTGTEYCAGTTGCAPNPTLAIATSNGPGCIDLGVAHSSPPAAAFTITGRRGATSTQYNRQASCGTPEASAEVRVLDADGRAIDSLETGALLDCANSIYGRWDIGIEVDGERSNSVEVVYYNSGCVDVATCAAARTVCGG